MLQLIAPRLALLRCDAAPDAPGMSRLLWAGEPDLSRALLAFLRSQGVQRAYFDGETRSWLVASDLLPALARYFLAPVAPARPARRIIECAA